MQPKRYWNTLMFMDNANYGGVVTMANLPEKIISNWNIADFLPVAIHKHFDLIISDFVLQIKKKGLLIPSNKENNDPNNNKNDEMEEVDNDNNDNDEGKSISSQLSQKMFHLVEEIQRTLSGDHNSTRQASVEFPKLAGTKYPRNTLNSD